MAVNGFMLAPIHSSLCNIMSRHNWRLHVPRGNVRRTMRRKQLANRVRGTVTTADESSLPPLRPTRTVRFPLHERTIEVSEVRAVERPDSRRDFAQERTIVTHEEH
jgi:hypothetical protein